MLHICLFVYIYMLDICCNFSSVYRVIFPLDIFLPFHTCICEWIHPVIHLPRHDCDAFKCNKKEKFAQSWLTMRAYGAKLNGQLFPCTIGAKLNGQLFPCTQYTIFVPTAGKISAPPLLMLHGFYSKSTGVFTSIKMHFKFQDAVTQVCHLNSQYISMLYISFFAPCNFYNRQT